MKNSLAKRSRSIHSGQHVLAATTYSKSVLRAVCGSMTAMFDDVDYFPSYELIASPAARGFFYEPNLRSINRNGVAHVMSQFLAAHTGRADAEAAALSARQAAAGARAERRLVKQRLKEDVICEEQLLEAFAQ